MFPTPVEKLSPGVNIGYRLILPICLFIWLLPLLAIFMTSIRPVIDINTGNVFGIPSEFNMIENYATVFAKTDAWSYMANTLIITIPTVIISVALACITGYALAIYNFRWALPAVFRFCSRQFCAVPDSDAAGHRHVQPVGNIQHSTGPGDVSCGLSDRVLHAVHAQFHESPAI